MLENPVKESRVKKKREEAKRKSKEEKKKRDRNEQGGREARAFRLDPSQAKFHIFLPLHHLWMGYISELLGLGKDNKQSVPSSASMHPKLVKADFHGSIITVRNCRNASLVGLTGVVIYETANAFRIVTRDDTIKLLPKAGAVFAFSVPAHAFSAPAPASNQHPASSNQSPASSNPPPTLSLANSTVNDIPHLEFELYGNQFLFRSADRTSKKFKPKETIAI